MGDRSVRSTRASLSCGAFELMQCFRVSSLIHERRADNRTNLQPLGWYREKESIPAILKGMVKIPLSNYGACPAERVTTV